MKPVYITPRLIARYYLEHEARINEDSEILLVLPDGTPCRIAYIDIDKHGTLVLQTKEEAIHGYRP
jgi:hypothetical protein